MKHTITAADLKERDRRGALPARAPRQGFRAAEHSDGPLRHHRAEGHDEDVVIEVERAIAAAGHLQNALEAIYAARDRGTAVPAARLTRLETLIEDCASHPAFADCDGFRKGYRL